MTYELDGRGPLYRQIKRAIENPILSGAVEPGSRLPSEHELMCMFDTSRMTVNRAMQMLADEGLIIRHRRNGTFVASQITEHSVLELREISSEIQSIGSSYRFEVLKRKEVKLANNIAESMGARTGSKALYLRCLHYADETPFVLEERYIHLRSAPAAASTDFTVEPPSRWLLENVPWSRAQHAILAINAPVDIAHELAIDPGDACLQIERTTWLAELPVTFVRLTYPGGGHRLVGRFTPGGEPA